MEEKMALPTTAEEVMFHVKGLVRQVGDKWGILVYFDDGSAVEIDIKALQMRVYDDGRLGDA